MIDAPIAQCRHSRFNTRKTRSDEAIRRLADRIARMGFERTRALWAVQAADQVYEVFAGGIRLEAARLAGLETVPILLHAGLSDDELSRLADVDNENDEYHTPVPVVDVWAEYHRLYTEEGWTQQRIAKAKGVHQPVVSQRLKYHGLPERIKRWVYDGELTEGHLEAITSLLYDVVYSFTLLDTQSPWLTAERAWLELAEKVVQDKAKNGSKSVQATRQDVATWKEWIAYADRVYNDLPEEITLYDFSGDEPQPLAYAARQAFVAALAERRARSLAKVKAAEQAVRLYIADNLAAYERFVSVESAEAARAAERAGRERQLLACFHHGDCVNALAEWAGGPIRLLLTDPPYGISYRASRRWRSKIPDRLSGDTPDEAMRLLRAAVEAAVPHLANDAHVLVFCYWTREPEVRIILQECGLTLKGSLVWVKEEHTIGELRGAFAPRHERIVHAVKGVPEVTPRIADVQEVPRSRETPHPAEKPVELLRRLIESTTTEGDLVVDPFAGCASTLVAAMRCGRRFWGAEIDEAYHEVGCRRLLEEGEARGIIDGRGDETA